MLVIVLLLATFASWVAYVNVQGEESIAHSALAVAAADAAEIARGEYLARAGNCMTCHTARGGALYAGGVAVVTPFGTVYSTNLTPDVKTGIGSWNAAHFWRALHHGRSRDGRLLYPAFPYPQYTHVTREDATAIFAYLRSLPAVKQPRREHALRFPYNTQAALAVWRALFFRPGGFEAEGSRSAEWNRGAYLVRGLTHCAACHSSRNALGATRDKLAFTGGVIPMQGWYAPSLTAADEAGVAAWDTQHVIQLLRTGVSPRGSVMGPMADVVYRSTQYLSDGDVHAIAVFLKALPQSTRSRSDAGGSWFSRGSAATASPDVLDRGRRTYELQCAQCHGDSGEGAPGIYPALAGNRAVTMALPANVIKAVLSGGYLPATRGNPRPYGMPPFAHVLSDSEIADVVTFIRSAWQNKAAPVSQPEVMRVRGGDVK